MADSSHTAKQPFTFHFRLSRAMHVSICVWHRFSLCVSVLPIFFCPFPPTMPESLSGTGSRSTHTHTHIQTETLANGTKRFMATNCHWNRAAHNWTSIDWRTNGYTASKARVEVAETRQWNLYIFLCASKQNRIRDIEKMRMEEKKIKLYLDVALHVWGASSDTIESIVCAAIIVFERMSRIYAFFPSFAFD